MVFNGSKPSRIGAAGILACMAVLGGCGASADGTDSSEVSSKTEALGAHVDDSSAESSMTTVRQLPDGTQAYTVTFNDDDPAFITFNNNSRQVFRGASLMGWRTVTSDAGLSAPGRLRPPVGWAALWGDPATTHAPSSTNNVYITNLAIPSSKFPAAGVIEGSITTNAANMCGAFVGGACIARSTDGGRNFSLSSADCVQKVTNDCPFGVFYDGSDMVGSPFGPVYAAYRDVIHSRVDVYMAQTPTGAFALVTQLNDTVSGHPRLRIAPDGLYLMYQSGSTLRVARYPHGTDRNQAWTAPVTVGTGVRGSDIVLSDRSVRVGPQFSFDVAPNESGVREVRAMYAVTGADGLSHLQGARCTTGAITCSVVSFWNTLSTPGGQWNPVVSAGISTGGVIRWAFSFHNRQNNANGNQVELWSGSIGLNPTSISTLRQQLPQVPCPDLRGYWGDYDNLIFSSFSRTFGRGFTDSSHAACSRANFHATPQNVALASWQLN